MFKLRVGVWVQSDYNPEMGGGYGYNEQILKGISTYSFTDAEIIFISDQPDGLKKITHANKYLIKNIKEKETVFQKRILKIGSLLGFKTYFYNKRKKKKEKLQNELQLVCDLIYYPVPGCNYPEFPFVFTIWDLGYINSYAFPEVTHDGVYEYRKRKFEDLSAKALYVLCESETGKMESCKYLKIYPEKIGVLPMLPGKVASSDCTPFMPEKMIGITDFIHYPAQFWSHKNHYNLLLAFKLVISTRNNLKLVLCGSDKGNWDYVQKLIRSFEMQENIIYLGFVSESELKWLYLNSKGLVFPTILGPTNMPPLESVSLGCPVAVSDLPGHREQLGDCALYFDPLDPENMANVILELLNIKNIPQLSNLPSLDKNMQILNKYWNSIAALRFNWK